MNTLNQKILNECREEVAKKQGFPSWDEMWNSTVETANNISSGQLIEGYSKEAALLAMDRQAEFFRWASEEQYLIWSNNYWVRFKTYEAEGHHFTLTGNREHGITELELYEIWEGQK